MSNNFEVGNIVTGKVTAIKNFGAFVALDGEKQGLVHISQVSHGFVKDIHEHLSIGDEVKVKIISIDLESGKISLSIRESQPTPKNDYSKKKTHGSKQTTDDEKFNTFEDKLKEWLKQSNENQDALNKRVKK